MNGRGVPDADRLDYRLADQARTLQQAPAGVEALAPGVKASALIVEHNNDDMRALVRRQIIR